MPGQKVSTYILESMAIVIIIIIKLPETRCALLYSDLRSMLSENGSLSDCLGSKVELLGLGPPDINVKKGEFNGFFFVIFSLYRGCY